MSGQHLLPSKAFGLLAALLHKESLLEPLCNLLQAFCTDSLTPTPAWASCSTVAPGKSSCQCQRSARNASLHGCTQGVPVAKVLPQPEVPLRWHHSACTWHRQPLTKCLPPPEGTLLECERMCCPSQKGTCIVTGHHAARSAVALGDLAHGCSGFLSLTSMQPLMQLHHAARAGSCRP